MVKLPEIEDPTLRAIDSIMESNQETRARPYLGASAIGDSCERKLWLNFRWVKNGFIDAAGLRRINDGHRGEHIIAMLLKTVPSVDLSTEKEPGVQHSFESIGGHFRGNCDGLLTGLLQDPETLYVWECKISNEAKYKKLVSLKSLRGDVDALKNWDYVYYAQAQVYMHFFEAKKHYLTVGSPGVRDIVSIVTHYDAEEAEKFIEKARRIIFMPRPAARISSDPAWHECKYCTFHGLCHEDELPRQKSCRTCLHSSPLKTGGWKCEFHKKELDIQDQLKGCEHHLFVPDIIPGEQVNSNENWVEYRMRDGKTWINSTT